MTAKIIPLSRAREARERQGNPVARASNGGERPSALLGIAHSELSLSQDGRFVRLTEAGQSHLNATAGRFGLPFPRRMGVREFCGNLDFVRRVQDELAHWAALTSVEQDRRLAGLSRLERDYQLAAWAGKSVEARALAERMGLFEQNAARCDEALIEYVLASLRG